MLLKKAVIRYSQLISRNISYVQRARSQPIYNLSRKSRYGMDVITLTTNLKLLYIRLLTHDIRLLEKIKNDDEFCKKSMETGRFLLYR